MASRSRCLTSDPRDPTSPIRRSGRDPKKASHTPASRPESEISVNGGFTGAVVDLPGRLRKDARLLNWQMGGSDIVYGGLGDDWIHGGAGNDALSGAEALAEFYLDVRPQSATPAIGYDDETGVLEFYDADDPRKKIEGFLLNVEPTADDIQASMMDVNSDGSVTPWDALLVINALGSDGTASGEAARTTATTRCDVTMDGRVTALDALVAINYLTRKDTRRLAPPDAASFRVEEPGMPLADRQSAVGRLRTTTMSGAIAEVTAPVTAPRGQGSRSSRFRSLSSRAEPMAVSAYAFAGAGCDLGNV